MYPVGFTNTGTICYLNSLLQSLLGCDVFNNFLLDNERKYNKYDITQSYIGIIKKTRNLSNEVLTLNDNITFLKNILNKIKSNDFGFSQEDASECFLLFLRAIDDKQIDKLFNHTYKCDIVCLNCNNSKSTENDVSSQFNIFNHEKITNIANHLRYNKTILEGFACENCKKVENIYKVSRLIDLPPIIIINFNKYYQKYETNYPDSISFKNNNEFVNYKLKSIINHFGSMNGGHYIAKSIRNGTPYLFNDSHYTKTNMETDMNSYILMYALD